jgi:hypothetical protein
MVLLQSLLPPSTLGILVLVMFVFLGVFVFFVKRNSAKDATTKTEPAKVITTVEDYVAMHGEPDTVFVLDATRSNDIDAVILAYEHEIVVEGQPVEREKVTNVTFYNAQNPYMDKEFRMAISATDPERPSVEVPVGNDAQYAEEIVTQLAEFLHC